MTSALGLLRFREWYYFLALPLAGMTKELSPARNTLSLARGVAIAFCVLGFGYLVNAASDVDLDVDVRKNPLLLPGPARPIKAVTTLLLLAAVGLAATGPRIALVATLVSLFSGIVYSVGPRLKALPIVGTLVNATNFVPLLWVGAACTDPSLARQVAPAFTGLLLQSQILHEAADAQGDVRGGIKTTFVVLGRGGSSALAALLGAVPAIGIATIGAAPRMCLFALYVVGFPAALAVLATDPARMTNLRRLHRLSGLATGVVLFARSL